jgi:hypothetical protein
VAINAPQGYETSGIPVRWPSDDGVAFLLMLEESLALRKGRDPMSKWGAGLRPAIPAGTYVLAVLIGTVLGHLLLP